MSLQSPRYSFLPRVHRFLHVRKNLSRFAFDFISHLLIKLPTPVIERILLNLQTDQTTGAKQYAPLFKRGAQTPYFIERYRVWLRNPKVLLDYHKPMTPGNCEYTKGSIFHMWHHLASHLTCLWIYVVFYSVFAVFDFFYNLYMYSFELNFAYLIKTRNTVSNAHKMISLAPPCFVWHSPCFVLGNPKIIRLKT